MLLVEKEMLILSGQPFSSCFCGARVAQSLVFCIRNQNPVLSTFMTYHRSLIMIATIWAGTLLEALVFIPILVHVSQSLVVWYLRFIVLLFVPFMLVIIMYVFWHKAFWYLHIFIWNQCSSVLLLNFWHMISIFLTFVV